MSLVQRGLLSTGALLLALGILSCGRGDEKADETPPGAANGPLFTEITTQVGLAPPPQPWPDGSFSMAEYLGPGVGLFDYDADGDLDLLHLRVPPPGRPESPAANRLLQQQADGTFRDVTEESGLRESGFSQAVAIGDVDNNGTPDVYFANYGPDALYLNHGDGTFEEATETSGLDDPLWGTSATFCDYDQDGDLDLFVVHYVRFDPKTVCLGSSGTRDYCGPTNFPGVPDRLLQNRGDGSFEDVTLAAGIRPARGGRAAKGLGVVCTDLTDDGLADIYVANDGEANHLWVNRGDGTFEDEALLRGVAVNQYGNPDSSMGLTVGDVDASGTLDLFMTHLAGQNNTLYLGVEGQLFEDGTARSGMARRDLSLTGFGCGLFDYDHDSDLDLAVVNGRIYRDTILPEARLGSFWNPYAEPNLLFENDGKGFFDDVSLSARAFSEHAEVTRGLAFGDLDRDGDLDLVLSNHDNTLRVFRNDAPRPGSHWLQVRALTGPRNALGAEVRLRLEHTTLRRLVLAGYSYMSSNDPRAHFGLGELDRVDALEVLWPDGRRESFPVGAVDRAIVVRQGAGQGR